MNNSNSIKRVIKEELEQARFQIRLMEAAVSDWPKVKKIFLDLGKISSFTGDIEYFTYQDSETGLVAIQSDGTAELLKNTPSKVVRWSLDGDLIKVGDITLNPKGVDAKSKETYRKKQEKRKQAKQTKIDSNTSLIDTIQTIADWAGFIPGFGDIIDAVNGIVYLARGKTLEGVLSLVAVIPVAGSVIKLALKGVIQGISSSAAASKAFKLAASGNQQGIRQVSEFWKAAIENGSISKMQLKTLAKYGDKIADILVSGKKYAPAALGSQIDDIASTIRNTITKPAKENFFTKIKAARKAGSKEGRSLTSRAFSSLANVTSVGTIGMAKNIIRKYIGGADSLKLLKQAMDVKFAKKLAGDTGLVTAVLKTSEKRLSQKQLQSIGLPSNFYGLRSENVIRTLNQIKTTNPDQWTSIVAATTKNAPESKYYQAFVDNAFSQAGNIFKPGAQFKAGWPDMFAKALKFDSYRLTNPKNVDIVYNELSDFAEKVGWDDKDDPQGVLMPALYITFREFLNSLAETGTELATGAATTAAAGLGLGGVDTSTTSTTTSQPSQPISTSGSEIKTAFKNAGGGTSDRLDALKQAGYSDEQIQTMKRDLGIE